MWGGMTVALIGLVGLATYLAGGTKTPIPHAFYIPVVIAAGMFGIPGGMVAAALAGVVCGPWMPLDVGAGLAQTTSGWLIRMGFFLVIGLVVGIGRDRVTRLREARQDFLSVVSHELRTPLASILGFASLLGDESDHVGDHERREFAAIILREATELSNVVDHYVVESRLEDSALFIESSPTDIRRVAEIVLDGLPDDIVSGRISIEGSEVICLADPLRVRQIVRSMINNALAYTADRLLIAISANKTTGQLTVTDRGPRPAAQRNLLNPISDIVTNTMGGLTTKPAPTLITPLGLGLAVSRDLARRMGGGLHYEVNKYTEITLRLPLQR